MSQQNSQPVVAVRRPRAIVFDILGTASKSGFLERVLFPYLKSNLDAYLDTHWNKKDFIKLYNKIMEQSIEFNKQEQNTPTVTPHYSPDARSTFMNFLNFITDNNINSTAVTQLRFKVWFEGYQQSKIKTPIYSDVPSKVKQWFAEGIKFYVYSNTWVAAQKALLRNTNHGDLTNLISGHYDNDSFGSLTDSNSWVKLCSEIKENPNDVLFLTKNSIEGRAACEAGIAIVLVLTHRHNVKAVPTDDLKRFPYVRSLNELGWLEGAMNPASGVGSGQASAADRVPTALSEQPTSLKEASSGATSRGTSRATSGVSSGVSSHSRSTTHSRAKDTSSAHQSSAPKVSKATKPTSSTATATATGTIPD